MIEAVCVGAGGHAEVLLEALQLQGKIRVIGLLDRNYSPGASVAGIPVLGTDERLAELRKDGVSHAVIGVGGFGSSATRKKIAESLGKMEFQILPVIHPSAIVSPSAKLGTGVVALAGSIVGCGAKLGDHVILNTASSVDHHCVIGDYSHLAPGVHLGGRVQLGEGVHLGVGVSVRDGLKVDAGAVVGAGAAVVTDLPGKALYAGVPARRMKSL